MIILEFTENVFLNLIRVQIKGALLMMMIIIKI